MTPTNNSDTPTRAKRWSPRMLFGAGALALILIIGLWLVLKPRAPTEPFRTAEVTRGSLERAVSASGTLQALITVQVGSQVSGLVTQVLVDFNSRVSRGDVLAILDPASYASRLVQAQADLEAASASLGQSQASLEQARAQLALDAATFERTQTLARQGIASPAALDQARATVQRSRAGVLSAQAAITTQRSRISQSRAAVSAVRVDLGRTRIISPIDGVVVDRQIDPGQTVAASFSAPILFRIAQDLSQVQVKIMVDEADIGQVRQGQSISFTVDAFPSETFTGTVTQVRLQPEVASNVVAYVVIAQAPNLGGRLLPGMTANANIQIERRNNVMQVPNAALRFTPADLRAPPPGRGPPGVGSITGGSPGGDRSDGGGGRAAMRAAMEAQLAAELQLTAEQREQVASVREQFRARIRAARGDPEAMTALRQQQTDRIKALLTPTQRTQYDSVGARLREQFGRARGAGGGPPQVGAVYVLRNNRPLGIPVRVGASNAMSTEITPIIATDLTVGAEVIVGGGPRPRAQARNMIPGSSGGGQQRR